MGLRQSKEEALYLRASCGNVEAVRALHRDGAGLEWVDKAGKTPLIFACSRPDGVEMARTLLELGANLNAYRPGSHAGTPLHHAAEKGLEQTVNLLLSHGANVLRMNDDCQTALDLARAKGHCNIVRNIEKRICFFVGWLRELYGPGFLKAFAPKWVSRKIWAVVLPCDQRSFVSPLRLQLAIYPTLQVAQPQTIISLWNVNIKEANFNQPDPVVAIVDKNNKKSFKFLSAHEGDKQQLLCFYNACKGMVQQNIPKPITHESLPLVTPALPNPFALASPANTSISAPEDVELAMAINASLQSAVVEELAPVFGEVQSDNASGWANSENTTNNGWGPSDKWREQNIPKPITHESLPVVTPALPNPFALASPANASISAPEDVELAMAINASLQSAVAEGLAPVSGEVQSDNASGWANSENTTNNGWGPSNKWREQNIPKPITHESLPLVTPALPNPFALASPANASISAPEDVELAMAINASLQSAVAVGLAPVSGEVQSDNASGWANSENTTNNGWGPPDRPLPSAQNVPLTEAAPSAPPLSEEIFTDGAINYPSIDSSPIDLPTPAMQGKFSMGELKKDRGDSGTCVVCLDAAVEGACIPCGHMAGCMSCLNDIKAKQWGCPVCRAKIDQVIKLFSV